tara:strand:- start:293 stop:631 length:339 start_codon:yes stop_codon:yes gene_type:complete
VHSFRYVFGSEEHLEYDGSINDAFRFFLTGSNPSGGMYVNQNIAVIPATTNTPVTIDNLNKVTNSAYYIDNGTLDGKINNNVVEQGLHSYSILVNYFKNKPFIYTEIVNLIK